MAPVAASGDDDSPPASSSPFSFSEGIGGFFSWDFCWAFRRRARRDCERERFPGVSEISESVVSLVWGGFAGVSLEDIVVVGRIGWEGSRGLIGCSWD